MSSHFELSLLDYISPSNVIGEFLGITVVLRMILANLPYMLVGCRVWSITGDIGNSHSTSFIGKNSRFSECEWVDTVIWETLLKC
jgi:hypothetical protein